MSQRLTGLGAVGAVMVGMIVGVAPVNAVQAPGDDAAAWAPGWAWTYQTSFRYYDASTPTDVTINENVTYSVVDVETFQGQTAYKLNINGTITGGSGSTYASGVGTANLSGFSGTVAGSRFVRVSDLALLQENQQQHLNATAKVSIISQGITADINLQLTPNPGWRTHDFPLSPGDNWTANTDVAYTGGFSYNAGSLGGSGSSPFDGTLNYSGVSTVSSATASVPIGNVATDYVAAQNSDGSMVDNTWWSPTYKNDAKEHMVLPLNGAQLTIDRNLSSVSTAAPANTISETITPSLTCAGGTTTVTGTLSSHQAGQPVSIVLDKAGTGTVTGSATTDANGAYSAALTVPGNTDGLNKNGSRANWGIIATSGSAMNVATLVVTRQDCSTLAYTGATSAPTGTSITAKATLTDLAGASAAGRTVSFALSGGATANATTDASGNASVTLPIAGNPRTATLTVSYAGASDLTAATSSTSFIVAQDATTTAVSASEVSATIGDPVTFTATVTPVVGSNPSGQVQFYVNGLSFGAPVGLSGTSATSAPYATTALGDLTITAQYLGDTTFAPSTSPGLNVHVHKVLAPTSTSISATPGTSVYGQNVNLSSHVAATADSGTPTGSVTFTEGGTVLGTAAVDGSGNASLDLNTLPVGSHSIVAKYSGDDDYNATSSAPANVSVAKASASVSLSSSDASTVAGQSVDLTVQVAAAGAGSGTPTGSVQLMVDGTPSGAAVTLSGGSAVFPSLTTLLAGDHVLSVSYAGDGNFTSGSDSLTQHVTPADTNTTVTVSPTTSAEDQEVVITANVAAVAPGGGSPTGTVTFTSDGVTIGAGALQANAGGGSTATLSTDSLPAGTHTIAASYGGDDSYRASDGSVGHTVVAATARVATTTTLTSSKNPSTYGELISYSAQVTATDGQPAGGTVQFSVDGQNFGDPVVVNASGLAQSDTLASPDPGSHTVIAAYTPDANHLGSGDTLTQTVNDASVAVHLTSSKPNALFGDSVTFSATVTSQQVGTGKPTGFVQFAVDGAALGNAVAISNGTATAPAVSNLSPGSHVVTATYSGDTHFTAALDTMTQSVGQIATTTVLTTGMASYGSPVSVSATVTPANSGYGIPGGTVSFLEGTTVLATAPLSGANSTASAQISGLSGGTHSIVAVYQGAGRFAGSTSAAKTAIINQIPTSFVTQAAVVKMKGFALTLGQLNATLNSSLGPVPGVQVVFSTMGTPLCTATTDANGLASCSSQTQLLNLVLGNGYKVTFAGNNSYAGSTGNGWIIQ
ncbi:MAG: beta strand repeat-containing protein [Marmoricola sp.]